MDKPTSSVVAYRLHAQLSSPFDPEELLVKKES